MNSGGLIGLFSITKVISGEFLWGDIHEFGKTKFISLGWALFESFNGVVVIVENSQSVPVLIGVGIFFVI